MIFKSPAHVFLNSAFKNKYIRHFWGPSQSFKAASLKQEVLLIKCNYQLHTSLWPSIAVVTGNYHWQPLHWAITFSLHSQPSGTTIHLCNPSAADFLTIELVCQCCELCWTEIRWWTQQQSIGIRRIPLPLAPKHHSHNKPHNSILIAIHQSLINSRPGQSYPNTDITYSSSSSHAFTVPPNL